MNSELAVSYEDGSDKILELIFTDEEGTTYYRENGEWVEVDYALENPTIFDVPLILVSDDFVDAYDSNDDLYISDTTQYEVL